MLDSLVRVSRRVGGVADLLATEMRTAPAKDARYTSPLSYPSDPEPGTEGSTKQGSNFTPALGPVPTVRRVNDPRNAATRQGDHEALSLRIRHPAAPHPLTGTSSRDFENASVYHYTVSRTLELSLQSSFQLSLTVLVCYRSRGYI